MPQRAASKVECPQELLQAVHLIVMFAVRKGGNLALEGREPGGFLGQVSRTHRGFAARRRPPRYICLRLMEGADIYQIAKNCRTSVEMIEKYYAVHIRTAIDTAAINVRRERPRRKKQREPVFED